LEIGGKSTLSNFNITQKTSKCMMEGVTILVSPQWISMIANQGILIEKHA
jgi:hypothetical protein